MIATAKPLALARTGDADAQCSLGVRYHNGKGVSQNFRISVKWYRRAAGQDDSWAKYLLGLCYRDGEGVHNDVRAAARWFEAAAKDGEKDAKLALKALKRRMPG